jgi:hypothetical protein
MERLAAREPAYDGSYDLLVQIHFQQGRVRDGIAGIEKAPESVRRSPRWPVTPAFFTPWLATLPTPAAALRAWMKSPRQRL